VVNGSDELGGGGLIKRKHATSTQQNRRRKKGVRTIVLLNNTWSVAETEVLSNCINHAKIVLNAKLREILGGH